MLCRAFLAISLLLACASGTCQLDAPTAISDHGYSSCSHSSCMFVPDEHPKTYRQGNFTYSASEEGKLVVRNGQTIVLSTLLKDLSASVFVTWSERSDWLAVTWSDGGAIGNFHTRVFQINGDSAHESQAVNRAFADFRSRHWCKARGDNVQAYGWDKEKGALVLVTSVYNTGDCGRDMGHMEAYFVRPGDGAILQHMTLLEFTAYARSHPQ
jgi:hypothetical protein